MEIGIVPPNLHYYNPREGVEALVAGRLKVHGYDVIPIKVLKLSLPL